KAEDSKRIVAMRVGDFGPTISMALPTLAEARKVPVLRLGGCGVGQRFINAIRYDVGICALCVSSKRVAIGRVVAYDHDARLEMACAIGNAHARREIKLLYEHGSHREFQCAILIRCDPLIWWEADPSVLFCAIRPERRVDLVWNQVCGRLE